MNISQLYVYPIKSLRAVPLKSAQLTKKGFPHDRTFMLMKREDGSEKLECMLIGKTPELALFTQELKGDQGVFEVTYHPPGGSDERSIQIPLEPDTKDLQEIIDTDLHGSPSKAFHVGDKYNKWFSDCFGYDVVLGYIGGNERKILGNLNPNQSQSWASTITSTLTKPLLGSDTQNSLTFADAGNYLITTEESLDDVSARFSDGRQADITKFRPNIVVKGSPKAWDEDLWGLLSINGQEIKITASCHRCQSINVDYKTGEYAKSSDDQVLKKLMKDRCVDPGVKYKAVFGRYAYLTGQPCTVNVGDEVEVTKRNDEHTVWDWPAMGRLSAKINA